MKSLRLHRSKPSPLLIAIHSVFKTADLLEEVCNKLLKKLMADKDKLTGLQQRVTSDTIKEVRKTDAEIQSILADVAEVEDDRLISIH